MLAPASVGARRWHRWHEGSQIPHLLMLELRRSWQLDAGVGWYAPVGAPADWEVVGWSRGGRKKVVGIVLLIVDGDLVAAAALE